MNNKLKKKLVILGLAVYLGCYSLSDYSYHNDYEIVDSRECFARYSLGKVYIGNRYYLTHLKDVSENDILIEDLRYGIDPNMKIYNSCVIVDKNIRNEILEIINCYEDRHPSRWNRSVESMRLEWFMHNLSHYFNVERPRTTDVDLNNKDEEKYDKIILRKIFRL